jgi:signal transduction histidine kinase
VLQALSNVVANALQHGSDPIRVVVRESEDRQHLETLVSNSGPAPTRDQIATMFDPFRTTKGKGGGVGLGLYIVRAIARAHGAITEVKPMTEGFCLSICWPRTPKEETPFRGETLEPGKA